MSENETGILLPVMGVNHAERIARIIAAESHRIHGAVITVEGKEINMPSIYGSVREAYTGLIANLRERGIIAQGFATTDDFSWVGFPFNVPNLSSLNAIDLILGIKDAMLYVEIMFQYKGSTAMVYTSGVNNGIISALPPEAPRPIMGHKPPEAS